MDQEENDNNFLKKYGKALATAGSAGVVSFAAIDQALQGDTQMAEMLAENQELIDTAGQQAAGVLGSIASEHAYSRIKGEDADEGFGRYAAMLAGGYAAGGAVSAAEYALGEDADLFEATKSATGALYATVAQMGADSHDHSDSSDKKYK